MKKLHLAFVLAAAAYATLLPIVGADLFARAEAKYGARVGPGFVDSFTVSCGSSATLIQAPSGKTQLSYTCQTPASGETGGTTLVAVGDSDIADPAFATRNSSVYSGDTIREFGGDVRAEYCRADTGTVTIFCRAMVAASTPP